MGVLSDRMDHRIVVRPSRFKAPFCPKEEIWYLTYHGYVLILRFGHEVVPIRQRLERFLEGVKEVGRIMVARSTAGISDYRVGICDCSQHCKHTRIHPTVHVYPTIEKLLGYRHEAVAHEACGFIERFDGSDGTLIFGLRELGGQCLDDVLGSIDVSLVIGPVDISHSARPATEDCAHKQSESVTKEDKRDRRTRRTRSDFPELRAGRS